MPTTRNHPSRIPVMRRVTRKSTRKSARRSTSAHPRPQPVGQPDIVAPVDEIAPPPPLVYASQAKQRSKPPITMARELVLDFSQISDTPTPASSSITDLAKALDTPTPAFSSGSAPSSLTFSLSAPGVSKRFKGANRKPAGKSHAARHIAIQAKIPITSSGPIYPKPICATPPVELPPIHSSSTTHITEANIAITGSSFINFEPIRVSPPEQLPIPLPNNTNPALDTSIPEPQSELLMASHIQCFLRDPTHTERPITYLGPPSPPPPSPSSQLRQGFEFDQYTDDILLTEDELNLFLAQEDWGL